MGKNSAPSMSDSGESSSTHPKIAQCIPCMSDPGLPKSSLCTGVRKERSLYFLQPLSLPGVSPAGSQSQVSSGLLFRAQVPSPFKGGPLWFEIPPPCGSPHVEGGGGWVLTGLRLCLPPSQCGLFSGSVAVGNVFCESPGRSQGSLFHV